MKVAVCVSGIPRSGIGARESANQNIERNFKNLKKNFPEADFFLGTWRQYEKVIQKELPNHSYLLFDEPEAHYHPYLDMLPTDMVSDKMRMFANIYRKKRDLHERTRHQAKQILCHAMMVDNLPTTYDVIIRTRYDTFTYPYANFNNYLQVVHETKVVIGFACLKWHHQTFDKDTELNKDIPQQNENLKQYLLDHLIIHHRDSIDTKHVYNLYENKKLCPAEFGWYQILSKPYNDNHRCISGWANGDRSVLKQFLTN